MKCLLNIVAICPVMFAALSAQVFAADICIEPDKLAPQVRLVLKRADKEGATFVGEFELQNNDFSPKIVLPGRRVGGVFYVDYPEASIEFLDLNRVWTRLQNHLPGTFLASPDALSIAIHSRASFKVELFSKSWGELSGFDYRLVLKFSDNPKCIHSDTFRAYPLREPISEIKSVTK
jgi:hypothetical protein